LQAVLTFFGFTGDFHPGALRELLGYLLGRAARRPCPQHHIHVGRSVGGGSLHQSLQHVPLASHR
jgi:hypothetical protein